MILVGDLFYERDTAARALAFLDRHAATGARVLVGDPGRTYLPKDRLTRLAEYSVPVTRELEDLEIKRTTCGMLRVTALRNSSIMRGNHDDLPRHRAKADCAKTGRTP